MDEIFRALADPTRRRLLDALFQADGQSLKQLERAGEMTRFGVMKHLAVLEQANLVTTQRRGREKLHFLNVVPIQIIYDRWVGKFARSWAAGLTAMKAQLEEETMQRRSDLVSWANGTAPLSGDTAVFEIFIKATPERVWQAITDPEERARYSFGLEVHSDWREGSVYTSSAPAGQLIVRGENLVVEPPRLLVQTFQALWSDTVRDQGSSRVTWELEAVGSSCRLTVTHDRLPAQPSSELYGGWPMILSGLKTLLETGANLDTPGSLRYAGA